jgi:hypothetical protein
MRRSKVGLQGTLLLAGDVASDACPEERYFPLMDIHEALAFAKSGGVAVHQNLDYGGTVIGGRARTGPFLHVLANPEVLVEWGRRQGMRAAWIQEEDGLCPHFDVFGSRAVRILRRLEISLERANAGGALEEDGHD